MFEPVKPSNFVSKKSHCFTYNECLTSINLDAPLVSTISLEQKKLLPIEACFRVPDTIDIGLGSDVTDVKEDGHFVARFD